MAGRAIKHGVCERWTGANPGWMQYCDAVAVDAEGLVTHVAGEPLDEERIYRVASFVSLARIRDGETIGNFLKEYVRGADVPLMNRGDAAAAT